ncbi:MAG: DNA recombination protein RmuC [Candidatus Parvarchaeota archaeon]|nr:DNA recombination protein RmuC [Candidatus Jingweiarchaeum tengchongense]
MILAIFIISILILVTLVYLIIRPSCTGKNALPPDFENRFRNLDSEIEKTQRTVSDEISKNRSESSMNSQNLRRELIETLNEMSKNISDIQKEHFDLFSQTLKNASDTQIKQLDNFSKTLQDGLNQLNDTLKNEIRFLQDENSKRLEEMRKTVDEKLQTTLEQRLSESFKIVSERLEQVYTGLGEMKSLASNVDDLKRVLTNVKSRGIFGELQLKSIIEDIMTPEQYLENAQTKSNTNERVEFAIKIPSKDEDGKYILLPVDSKFLREDYEKILDAEKRADQEALETAIKGLTTRITNEAKDITKYINPPVTTDFAVMFLPTESLFAEVLRIPELSEQIRKNYKVIITGPTTIAAFLNSLQIGFKTLAVEKMTSEVWTLLTSVKTEFAKFTDYLSKTKEKLQQAVNNMDKVEKSTQTIGKKLKDVESLDSKGSEKYLGLENIPSISEEVDKKEQKYCRNKEIIEMDQFLLDFLQMSQNRRITCDW